MVRLRIVSAVVLVACGRIDFGRVGDANIGDTNNSDAAIGDAEDDVVLVSDDFGRSIASGWGSADVGGAWLVFNPESSGVSVGAGHGDIAMSTTTAYADCHVVSTTALDTETSAIVSFDHVPTSGSYTVTISARWVANGTDYRIHLDVLANGSLDVYIDRATGSGYSDIEDGTSAIIVTAGAGLALSLRATGASPTTLCGKLWLAGSAAPSACTVSTQDSTPQLQVPGISYIDTYDTNDMPPTVSVATFRYLRVGPQ